MREDKPKNSDVVDTSRYKIDNVDITNIGIALSINNGKTVYLRDDLDYMLFLKEDDKSDNYCSTISPSNIKEF